MRSWLKGVLIVVVGATLLFSACAGGLFLWVALGTAEIAEEADRFLSLLAAGRTQEAYLSTSDGFRAEQDEPKFTDVIGRVGVTGHELQPWRDRTLASDGRMRFGAMLMSEGGGRTAATMELVKEGDDWKVLSLTGPRRVGIGPGAWFRQRLSEKEAQMLSSRTLLDFDKALKMEDFSEFFGNMSMAFRVEASPRQLQAAFQHLIDDGLDLSGVAESEAKLDRPPSLIGSGIGDISIVSGQYPIEPDPIRFRFQYSYQHPKWKLYKLNVEVTSEE